MRTCKYEGCTEVHHAKGYCRAHYVMHHNRSALVPLGSRGRGRRVVNRGPCRVNHCTNEQRVKGYCRAHYQRFWREEKASES